MLTILVTSSKGGCGKTTLATNLAAHFAQAGKNTVLVDADRQGSSQHWAEKRAGFPAAVLGLSGQKRGWAERVPKDAERVIVDSPAGIRPAEVAELSDSVDAILVPVLPSRIDYEATQVFLHDLAEVPRIKRGKLPVGLVANRLKPWTNASQQALEDMRALPFPTIAGIRDTQGYVLASALGKSIFDYNSESVRQHQEDWERLLRWLKKLA